MGENDRKQPNAPYRWLAGSTRFRFKSAFLDDGEMDVSMHSVSLVGFPFYSLSKYRGMGAAVSALRSAGISKAVSKSAGVLHDLGDTPPSDIIEDSGPANLWNFPHFLKDTEAAQQLASKVDPNGFVICVGGGCTFAVGELAGFKSKFKGKPGMLWIDAHGDFNTPETTTSGFIGGMPLAFACGRGPRLTNGIEKHKPLLQEENVVHFGSRALDQLEAKAMAASPMKLYPATEVHVQGPAQVALKAASYLSERSDWIACHLDVDAIDPTIIGSVNLPEPNGLTLEEIKSVIAALNGTGKLKVFDLAAYNPVLDQNHASANKLITLVSEMFPPGN